MNALAKLVAASGLAFAACAWAQPAPDLVILPAPVNAWHTFVGHWENQVELMGERVVVPAPTAEYARNSQLSASAGSSKGLRDTLTLDWKDLWQAKLRVESAQPLDLRPYLGGVLALDLKVDDLSKGGLKIKVACGPGCERSVSVLAPARSFAGQGWQHVALAMSCFAREGADFSKVSRPFALEADGIGRVSVAQVRIAREGQPTLTCPDYRTQSVTAAPVAESWSIEWWMPRHEKKLQELHQLIAAGHSPELVFIGDSITEGWEKSGREVWQRHYGAYHPLNLGYGGDLTENVLWRLQHGEIDGIAPKAVVLMIGTNNTGHRAEDPQTTAAGIKRLVDEIRQRLPAAQVLLLAVFPRDEKPDGHARQINERVNAVIAGHADGRHVHFLNINAALTQPDGTLSKDVMPDLLHPNEKGYAIWQREMDPLLQKLLHAPQVTPAAAN
jgi:beta-glucosidase